jgi:maleamate amidohydrolase
MPLPDDVVVTQQYASAFFATSLSATLTTMGCDTVVLSACGDRHQRPHEASLFDLQAKSAEVVDEQAAIRVLARD